MTTRNSADSNDVRESLNNDYVADQERSNALRRLLKAGDVVIDVGANRGQFALQLLATTDCRVFAFEPVPAAFNDLRDLSVTNPAIIPIQSAVSPVDGEVIFYVQESDLGSSLLEPVAGQSSQWLKPQETITVPSVRLDSFITQAGMTEVGLLKTDAQGFDGQVIASAGELLTPDSIGAIMIEMNFHQFYEGQEAFHDVIGAICGKGYFLADIFRHYNRESWLWWADVLFLPNRPPYST